MYRMEKYFWWNEAQRRLADEVAEFSDSLIASTIEDIEKTKRFPWEYMEEMGKRGDGYMRDYPVERHFRDSKLIEIGAGANEILKHLVWKQWLKRHRSLRKSMRKKPVTESRIRGADAKKAVLELLAEFYKVHPALYTECDEILENLEITRENLNECLTALEADKLVALYRKRGAIQLAKATYDGLRIAKPQEFYLKFPDFVDKEREVF